MLSFHCRLGSLTLFQYTCSPVSEEASVTTMAHKRSPRHPSSTHSRTPSSSHTATARHPHPSSPRLNPQLATPPPTPPSPFNAYIAAAQCRAMDGYVSFSTIEGLGVPEGEDYNGEEDAGQKSRWLKWLSVGRGRSDSTGSVGSR